MSKLKKDEIEKCIISCKKNDKEINIIDTNKHRYTGNNWKKWDLTDVFNLINKDTEYKWYELVELLKENDELKDISVTDKNKPILFFEIKCSKNNTKAFQIPLERANLLIEIECNYNIQQNINQYKIETVEIKEREDCHKEEYPDATSRNVMKYLKKLEKKVTYGGIIDKSRNSKIFKELVEKNPNLGLLLNKMGFIKVRKIREGDFIKNKNTWWREDGKCYAEFKLNGDGCLTVGRSGSRDKDNTVIATFWSKQVKVLQFNNDITTVQSVYNCRVEDRRMQISKAMLIATVFMLTITLMYAWRETYQFLMIFVRCIESL